MSQEEFDDRRAHLVNVSRAIRAFERVMGRLDPDAAMEAIDIIGGRHHQNGDAPAGDEYRARKRRNSAAYRQRNRGDVTGNVTARDRSPSPVTVTGHASPVTPGHATVVSSSVVGSGSEASKKHKIRELLQKYDEGFLAKFGSRPVIAGGKDAKLAQKILQIHGDDALRLVEKFFESDDDFIQNSGYSFGVFHSVVNKLITSDAPKSVPLIPKKQAAGLQAWLEMKEAGHDITGLAGIYSPNGHVRSRVRGGEQPSPERGVLPGPE